jgi:hypothetical protein
MANLVDNSYNGFSKKALKKNFDPISKKPAIPNACPSTTLSEIE